MHWVLTSFPSYWISSTLKTHKKIKIYSKYSLWLYNEIINTLNFTCWYPLKWTKYLKYIKLSRALQSTILFRQCKIWDKKKKNWWTIIDKKKNDTYNGATKEKNVRQKNKLGIWKTNRKYREIKQSQKCKKKVNAVKKTDLLNKMALEHKTVDAEL